MCFDWMEAVSFLRDLLSGKLAVPFVADNRENGVVKIPLGNPIYLTKIRVFRCSDRDALPEARSENLSVDYLLKHFCHLSSIHKSRWIKSPTRPAGDNPIANGPCARVGEARVHALLAAHVVER